MSSLWNRVLI